MENFINDELLISYLMETATAEENVQVNQWCNLSDENQRTVEDLYFMLQVSDRLKVIKSTNYITALADLKDRIQQKEKSIKRQIILRRFQGIASILFLPVMLTLIVLLLQKNNESVQYIEINSNPGMVASFDLPDGSKVWLNGGSSLHYPNIFKGKKREVKISGEGYFNIAHNSQQPFLVNACESF